MFEKQRPAYKGPEGQETKPRLPDGTINWDYVGSDAWTLREWYDYSVGEYLGRVGETPQTRQHAENQFEYAVDTGLIT
jgi:hypothetical protein